MLQNQGAAQLLTLILMACYGMLQSEQLEYGMHSVF